MRSWGIETDFALATAMADFGSGRGHTRSQVSSRNDLFRLFAQHVHARAIKHDLELVRLLDLWDRHEIFRHTWNVWHVNDVEITHLTAWQQNTFVHCTDTKNLRLRAIRHHQITGFLVILMQDWLSSMMTSIGVGMLAATKSSQSMR